MRIGNREIEFGFKEFIVISLAFFTSLGIAIFYTSYNANRGPTYPSLSNSNRFDATTGAIVLTPATSFNTSASCDVYVSPPDRQIKYFNTLSCDSLSSTTINQTDLLAAGNGEKGTYTIVVFSEQTSEGTSFSMTVS